MRPTAVEAPAPSPNALARARTMGKDLVDGFERNDLLTFASAISFQIMTAVVPFLLFVLAVAGLLHAHGLWRQHLAPQIRDNVPPAMFAVIRSAVDDVLTHQAVLWATFGGLLALWQVSGAVRAVMAALCRVYDAPGERPFVHRFAISFVLSIAVGACFTLVAACLLFAPFFFKVNHGFGAHVLAFVIRWILVVAVLYLVVALLLHQAPTHAQPWPWVTLGAALVTGSWILASVLFYIYLTDIASYQTVFGSLASVIVTMGYLYVSTTTFLFGAQLDALIRREATGRAWGGDG